MDITIFWFLEKTIIVKLHRESFERTSILEVKLEEIQEPIQHHHHTSTREYLRHTFLRVKLSQRKQITGVWEVSPIYGDVTTWA